MSSSSAPPILKPSTFPKLTGPARAAAIAEPGDSWREYLYMSFAKAWVLLGFGIIDAWAAAAWFHPLNIPLMFLSLAGATYLEFLLWRYLWYRPDPTEATPRGPFQPTWTRPVRFGRWTPEAWSRREGSGGSDPTEGAGPDPAEFL
jgi:hypothetical protein